MRKFLSLILLFIFAVNNSFGSPLIFKTTKEIDTKDFIELGSFDATKYRQIRIGIKVVSNDENADMKNSSAYAQLIQKRAELTAKLQNLKTIYKERHPEVLVTQNQIDEINDEIARLNRLSSEKVSGVSISGVEGKEEIILFSFEEINLNRSIVIDSPPAKISVKIFGKGLYSLYVWGQ